MVYLRVLHHAEMYKASQHTPLAQMRQWLRGRQTSFRTTSTDTIGISVIDWLDWAGFYIPTNTV